MFEESATYPTEDSCCPAQRCPCVHKGGTRRTSYSRLKLQSFSHVSFVVKKLEASRRFYCELLGFSELVRPGALKERCNGCWLFNYNIGLHLLEGEPPKRTSEIRPEADHFSFQTEDIAGIERELKALGVHYISDEIEHEGVRISQLFFHDPDRNMIEICNCDTAPMRFLEEAENCSIHNPSLSQTETWQNVA